MGKKTGNGPVRDGKDTDAGTLTAGVENPGEAAGDGSMGTDGPEIRRRREEGVRRTASCGFRYEAGSTIKQDVWNVHPASRLSIIKADIALSPTVMIKMPLDMSG